MYKDEFFKENRYTYTALILKQYELKSGFLDRPRKLVLTSEYVEFENKDLLGSEFTRLPKSDILDFKHGIDWIVWYKFTVGRQFSITFKDRNKRELKILFRSYFGLNGHYYESYSEIVESIWEYYHQGIVDDYLEKFYNNVELTISGIKLNESGILLAGHKSFLTWDRLDTKDYRRYFAIYDKQNPEIHSRVSYNEYGTEILWSAIKRILREKGN
jgi:hypothetical protein